MRVIINLSFCIFSLILIFSPIVLALDTSIRFNRISTEHGLPQVSANTILSGSRGFIWVGTQEGLARFDGYNFKVFKYNPNNSNSISSSFVQTIIEDRNGNFWLGTRAGGLNRFDPKTETFTHYKANSNDFNGLSHNDVVTLFEDHSGNIWIGTRGGGLNRYNVKTQMFSHYSYDTNNISSLSNNNVTTITEDQDGSLWIGTDGGGLNRFNPQTEKFTHFTFDANDENSLSNNRVSTIIIDSNRKLWIGTRGGGVNRLEPNTEIFKRYKAEVKKLKTLSDDFVLSICEDNKGDIWIGTRDNGVDRFTPRTEEFINYKFNLSVPNSLSDDSILSIMEDPLGNMWIGTYSGGISLYIPKTNDFNHHHSNPKSPTSLSSNNIRAIKQDRQGFLWIGTSNGLEMFDSNTKSFTNFRSQVNEQNSLSDDFIWTITEDRQGILWVGTQSGGLNRFDPNTKSFTHLRSNVDEPNSLSDDYIWVITEDRQGILWIGTQSGGLNRFDPNTKVFTHFRSNVEDPNSLSDDNVRVVTEDSQGILWIGTNSGLDKFNPLTQSFSHYSFDPLNEHSLSNDAVRDIIEDKKGNLWIGTRSGLNVFDKETEKFKYYRESDGLPNDVIYQVIEDNDGFIWVSTNQGLSKLDPQTETFKNYDSGDGLQNNEFNGGASFKSINGELFFGGVNGFNRFFPMNIKKDITPPNVVIVEMSVLNNQVVIEPYSEKSSHNQDSYILNNAIHTTKSITLTYLENIISLEFSALHFSNPKKNLYAYQLEGFDKNWVHTDFKNRRASYTNLPAGEYNFKVKASNADGYWNEEGTSLKITVLPPPWKTWWAYSLYGICLLSLVLRFIHYQRKKVIFERNLNAQLENKVVERTSQLQYKTEELQKSNTMLEKMSLTDQLTGLKNRRFLLNNIESDISLVLRKYKSSHDSMNTQKPEEADLIFFLIDLDHFKMVNDVYGHTAGDAVLIQIKVILKQVFREADYLVRWGGEEFLVIARFTERNNAPELAERLRQAVESHDFDIGDEKILKKTCSIGFACYPFSTGDNEALSWEQVVDVADHCMYAAKKSSRNAWVGLYNENTEIGDSDLFTMVIEQTQSLIQTDELKILSSIIDVDQVNW
jgi:diguanylate cyclase (GGDEF)-like protein